MTDQPDNQVLALLRDMQTSLQRTEERLDGVPGRGSPPGPIRTRAAVDLAALAVRPDRMDSRLDRIERRLHLVGA